MNKTTLLEINFISNTVKVLRIDNGYKNANEFGKDFEQFRKYAWKCLHSTKVIGVSFVVSEYYSKEMCAKVTIKDCIKERREVFEQMFGFCVVYDMKLSIVCRKVKFQTMQEYRNYCMERMQTKAEWNVSVECVQLLAKYARELMPYLQKSVDVLTEVLRNQIKLSGYDVDMSSITVTDGLNHGKIDDSKGIREWSRDYTKHYERYNQNLIDLINMYINCKFYKQAEFETLNAYGISESDVDSYTGERITEPIQIRLHEEDVVVPVSACGEYVQMYMN